MGRRKKVRTGSDRSPVPAVSAEELTQSESLRESSWEQLEMCIGGKKEGEEERGREMCIGGKKEGEGERGRGGGAILCDERRRGYIGKNRCCILTSTIEDAFHPQSSCLLETHVYKILRSVQINDPHYIQNQECLCKQQKLETISIFTHRGMDEASLEWSLRLHC